MVVGRVGGDKRELEKPLGKLSGNVTLVWGKFRKWDIIGKTRCIMNSGRKADRIDCPWELLRISVVVTMLPLPFKAKRRAASGVAEPSHKPELDGIRGIALLAVMLSHGGPYIDRTTALSKIFAYAMIPGWSGVELFFVLSGFLITGILLKSKKAENYFSSFYARRFLRIFPIYYFVLTVGLLAATHVSWWNALLPAAGKTRIAYYFYAQNWPMFWPHHLFLKTNGFGHFWSLAVEEQFYIVWPLVIWLLPENAILTLCAVGLAVALPLRVLMVHKFAYDFTAMALTTSRVDGLLVGVFLPYFCGEGKYRGDGFICAWVREQRLLDSSPYFTIRS